MDKNASDLHVNRFATRAAGYQPSPVRAVFDLSMKPGMISLAGGNPYLQALQMDAVGHIVNDVFAERGLEALQYGAGSGTGELREAICQIMALEGISATPENVQVTAGSQMGLDLITKLFCDPGDVVLAEGPTYVGALSVFEGLEVEVVHVPMDADGVIPMQLETTIADLKSRGRSIKFLYTIPNFNNPTGISLSESRRPEIVQICSTAGVAIVEDNPYGLLSFDGTFRPALRSIDPDNIFYLGSFSKIFSPGLRIGWIVAPSKIRAQLQIASEATTICPSLFSQLIIERYISDFDWRSQIASFSAVYREHCEAALAALDRYMPKGTTWTTPTGGFFTWITLPEGCHAEDLLPIAIDAGVVFIPGSAFYADDSGHEQVRIAFSFVSPEEITEGVRRFAGAISHLMATPG